jgi:hypothetical protein
LPFADVPANRFLYYIEKLNRRQANSNKDTTCWLSEGWPPRRPRNALPRHATEEAAAIARALATQGRGAALHWFRVH